MWKPKRKQLKLCAPLYKEGAIACLFALQCPQSNIKMAPSAVTPESKQAYATTASTRAPVDAASAATSTSSPSLNKNNSANALGRVKQLYNKSPLKVAWFAGNLAVVVNSIFYVLSSSNSRWNQLWYRFVFLGALDAFGVVIYQTVNLTRAQGGKISFTTLTHNDDIHYLYYAFIWLLLPRTIFAIVPLFIFSTFHVLNFFGTELLPTLGLSPGLSNRIVQFIKKNNDSSRRIAANFELLFLVVLLLKALSGFKYSWISLLAYSSFIKAKTERSVFTKNVLKNWEVRIDGLVSAERVPPAFKTVWGVFKRNLKRLDRFSITRELTTNVEPKYASR